MLETIDTMFGELRQSLAEQTICSPADVASMSTEEYVEYLENFRTIRMGLPKSLDTFAWVKRVFVKDPTVSLVLDTEEVVKMHLDQANVSTDDLVRIFNDEDVRSCRVKEEPDWFVGKVVIVNNLSTRLTITTQTIRRWMARHPDPDRVLVLIN